jgi:ABC-2 type transport system ATP-binding protein
MAQALGLAACFLAARDLLVLDEPMSGLDPRARALVKRELRRLHARGTTVLFTSHALADVDELGAAVAVLDGGIVRFEGTPGQLRAIHRTNDLEEAFLACVDRCVVPRSSCSNEPSP